VKACPPTKGRLSRGLPNLATRTLASAKEPRFGSRLFASWSKTVFWHPRHDFGDSSPNTSAPFNPAKRTSKMVREPSGL